MNTITKIFAGLLLVAAALIGLYALLLARQPAPVEPAAMAANTAPATQQFAVVVVSKALTAGKPITADSVRLEKLPIKPAESFGDVGEVVGKVPVADVGEGVPMLQSHLSGGLASQVALGERAVAVNVDESIAVGFRVKPGDFVDVFFVLRQDNGEITPSQGRLLLSKLRVLAVGGSSVNEEASKADPNRTAAAVRTAVLAVPTADINQLNLAQNAGRLTLALRNPKDEELPSANLFPSPPTVIQARNGKDITEPVNQAFAGTSLPGLSGRKDARAVRVVSAGAPAGPLRPAIPVDNVEIIRGGVRQ